MNRIGWSVSFELLKNQISLQGIVVVHVTAAALPVQPQSSASDSSAARITPAGPVINGEGLGAATVAAGFVAAVSPLGMPTAWRAQPRNVTNIDRENRSDAMGAAAQGAFIRVSNVDGPMLCRLIRNSNCFAVQPS